MSSPESREPQSPEFSPTMTRQIDKGLRLEYKIERENYKTQCESTVKPAR